jgi:hypothetical protein
MDKAASGVLLTDAQRKTITDLKNTWDKVGPPEPLIGGGGCVMCYCESKYGGSIWIGIEKDGYAHS